MLFNSFSFAIFLPIVFILYWAMPHRFRWLILLISSYYFYMSWDVKYVSLILLTTVVSYWTAILLERTESFTRRRLLLAAALIVSLGILFFFKYFNFVCGSVAEILELFSIHMHPVVLKVLLPVGISFYTFQTLSYVLDVYWKKERAEHHFGKYAAFISFFPQLVAGPIERTGNLLPQIKAKHEFQYEQATYGLKLMAWGFYKKIVIADTLAIYVDTIYDNVFAYQGFSLLCASLFFAIQIYCDFSGYSDIAVGTAKLFGIELMDNFRSPYFSSSIKEFWSRWHISLSTWFRDYVYIPLGGNRVGRLRHYVNLVVTFLVSGLWHGANRTFVLWGGVHGLAQVIENILFPRKNREYKGIRRWLGILVTFTFCCFAWILFRAQTISEAGYVMAHMFDGLASPLYYVRTGLIDLAIDKFGIIYLMVFIFLLALYDYISLKKNVIQAIGKHSIVVRWMVYVLLAMLIIFFTPNQSGGEFIYFQF